MDTIGAVVVGDKRYILKGDEFPGFVQWLEKQAIMVEDLPSGRKDTRVSGLNPAEVDEMVELPPKPFSGPDLGPPTGD